MRVLRVAGFISKGLREQGYAVDVVENNDQTLHLASINEYDLMILDIMLPVMDGNAICRQLRATGFRRRS